MKIVDVNLLLYAVNEDTPLHGSARAWVEASLSGSEPIGFDWTVLLAFLRLSTKSAVFPKPLAFNVALSIVASWLAQPCVVVVQPGERHLQVLAGLLRPFGTAGNLTSDAHLAALAIEYGAELCSCDNDFSRFAGLRWTNPLD